MTSISDIETLLNEPIAAAANRAASEFDRIAGQADGIVLFGAGLLGMKTLRALRNRGIEPLAFSDNNSQKWNQSIDGIAVLSPTEAANVFGRSAVFVVTIWSVGHSQIRTEKQLAALGCKTVVPWAVFAWKYAPDLLPHYLFDLPQEILREHEEIRKAFLLMADEESREVFKANLSLRLKCDFRNLPEPSRTEQYFPADIVSLTSEEVFIDGGAYEGDTIAVFLRLCQANFREIIAFEPDPQTYEKLCLQVSSLGAAIATKISCRNCALGRTRERLCFDAAGTPGSCASASGSAEVECVTLDEEPVSGSPTFVKLDVEGSELDALAGAGSVIETAGPLLAVCVYHRPSDLWRVPLYIAGLNPGYRFYLRQHEEDGRETVVYAIPSERKGAR